MKMTVMVSIYIAFALMVIVCMLAIFFNMPLLEEATEKYFMCEATEPWTRKMQLDPVEKYGFNSFLSVLFQIAFIRIPVHGLVIKCH